MSLPRTLHTLPSTVNPVNEICLLLFVPDDPAYVQAVAGQLGQLGKWYNWQRDDQHTAADVAQRWLQSYRDTLELWSLLEYDMCPLTINVTCGGQSNGCCPTYPSIELNVNLMVPVTVYNEISAIPPDTYGDNGIESPMPSYPTYSDYQQQKCNYANQFASDLLATWDKLSNIGLAASTLSIAEVAALVGGYGATFFVGLVGAGVVMSGGAAAILSALVALGALGGAQVYRYFNDLLQEWDQDALVCAIYGATNAEEARQNLADEIGGFALAAGIDANFWGTNFIAWLADWVLAAIPTQILEGAFGETEYLTQLPDSSCALCSGVTPPPEYGLFDSLLHYWELEEASGTRVDSHGNLDLAAVGTTSANVNGVTGSALYLISTGQVMSAPHQIVPSGSWAIAGWISSDGAWGANNYWFSWGDNSSYSTKWQYGITSNVSGGISVNYKNVAGTVISHTVNANLSTNTWHFVIVEFDADDLEIRVYVDGSEEPNTFAAAGGFRYGSQRVTIGGVSDNGGIIYAWDGSIDEVLIIDRVFTPAERAFLWNVGQGIGYENLSNPGGEP